MYIFIGALAAEGGKKESGCEDLDICVTLSILLIDPKRDCQKIRGRLYFPGSLQTRE